MLTWKNFSTLNQTLYAVAYPGVYKFYCLLFVSYCTNKLKYLANYINMLVLYCIYLKHVRVMFMNYEKYDFNDF